MNAFSPTPEAGGPGSGRAAPAWIEWSGGDCPLRYGQTFDLRYRDGVENSRPRVADDIWMHATAWVHHGTSSDIVAYRVRG